MAKKNEKKKNTEAFDVKRDSFVYKFSNTVCKWFLVSLMFYFCSIPVFTIGTASCAAIAVTRVDFIDIREIFGSFFSYFRSYFKKTVPVFLLFVLFLLLQLLNLSFYHQFAETGTLTYYILTGIIIILIVAAVSVLRFYNYEVTCEEPVAFKQRFLNSLRRMMRCLPAVGLLALMDIGITATIASVPIVFPILFAYPGLHAFLMCIPILWFENKGKGEDNIPEK